MLFILVSHSFLSADGLDTDSEDTLRDQHYDYVPDIPYDTVAKRLSLLEKEIPLVFNTRVKAFIDYFTIRDREYTRMIMRRKNKFFPLFEKYLAKYNLPDELKYLSIIESGLNTRARSRVGAMGLWQFMPYTGKIFHLDQDWFIDERMDPEKATEAACLYLQELYSIQKDWELALASYNAGPGNVRKAIRRSGYKKRFWEVYRYLPRETRSYVPQFVAIIYVLNYAEDYNLFTEDEEYQMIADTIQINGYCHLPTLANLLGICPEDLEELNPELKRSVVPKNAKKYPLRIPYDKVDFLTFHRKQIMDSASNAGKEEMEYIARNTVGSTYGRQRVIHRVRSGDVLGRIAERYHVRVADIRAWNNIRGNLIRVGQRLNIYVKNSYVSSNEKSGSPQPVPNSKIHIVQPGDTLWNISRQYQGLSIEKIKELNNLKDSRIKPGQKLLIG